MSIDLYVLREDTMENVGFVLDYNSMVWTDRYSSAGEFSLSFKGGDPFADLLSFGRLLRTPKSKKLMMIQSKEISVDDSGELSVIYSGESLEARFKKRVISWDHRNPANLKKPSVAMRDMMAHCFGDYSDAWSWSRNNVVGLMFTNTAVDPNPAEHLSQRPLMPAYEEIEKLAKSYNLGINLMYDFNAKKYIGGVYTGIDRTATLTFSTLFNNIDSTRLISSTINMANQAVVVSGAPHPVDITQRQNESIRVDAPKGVNPTPTGFALTQMLVQAPEVKPNTTKFVGLQYDDPTFYNALTSIGKTALSRTSQPSESLDAKIEQNTLPIYNNGYSLGDKVTVMDPAGGRKTALISEVILGSSEQGDVVYPGFTVL